MRVRLIEESDRQVLEDSIAKDEYCNTTDSDFFYDPRAICSVYEDENPVMFVKGSTVLRLDIQFCNNSDKINNALALQELSKIIETSKAAGFSEIVFCTDSPLLKIFCMRHFKFEEISGELVRYL